jgi:hypothetical protein
VDRTLRAFRISLVCIAATFAALLAHVAIDIAGDYVLAHDAYDGIDHQSRAIFVVAAIAAVLVVASRVLFKLLDRSSNSHESLLRRLSAACGSPAAFILQTAFLAIVTLAGMELLDCALSGTPVDGIEDLFGGSLALGLGTTLAIGALAGWCAHGLMRLLGHREAQIAALLYRFVFAAFARPILTGTSRRARMSRTLERALLLARRGSKRGPPLALPG